MYGRQERKEKEMDIHKRWEERLRKRLGEGEPRDCCLAWDEEGLARRGAGEGEKASASD
ncbi:MAG: hypothetical protein ACP5UM_07685 [Anaerolineae bacterium]